MADWSTVEVNLLIADYFSMLAKELAGIAYKKSEHRRMLQPLLNNRTEASIEFKHQNVSAVLIELGTAFIPGYKPRYNYQSVLKDECINQLEIDKSTWENKFEVFADAAPAIGRVDYNMMIDMPPERRQEIRQKKTFLRRRPFKINYLEREQQNSKTGIVGEKIALDYERWSLQQAGHESLADKVEWVSEYDDGAGFDVLSKYPNGADKYIEVKSTKLSKETPIFFSKAEFEFALTSSHSYHLYRIFNLSGMPKLFSLNGDFDSFCTKEPVQYKGYF